MSGHRLRRCPNIQPTLVKFLVFDVVLLLSPLQSTPTTAADVAAVDVVAAVVASSAAAAAATVVRKQRQCGHACMLTLRGGCTLTS